MTREHAIEGMAMAKEAGIETLLSFIFGLGGKERSREHIEGTVSLLNILQPEQIAPMALAVQPGTELEREVHSGEFILPTDAGTGRREVSSRELKLPDLLLGRSR